MATQLTFPSRQRGTATVVALLVIAMLAVFGFSMIESVTSAKDETAARADHQQRLYLAESALDAAIRDLDGGGTGVVGSQAAPVALGNGSFYTLATDHGDGTRTVYGIGVHQRASRIVRGRVRISQPVFHHAIFAGNSSDDPDYEMTFGGTGVHADDINGDVYSGGGIVVGGDADLSGTARAHDSVVGMEGEGDVSQAGFDFEGIELDAADIVDVAAEFATWGALGTGDEGGEALEVPASNLAHIFRLNPSDRTGEAGGTVKDDYFLEDPYEVCNTDSADDGSNPAMITIDDGTGVARATYFIDGNLWVHNRPTLSFALASTPGSGTQVTFIVKGNITFSDSFRLQDPTLDAMAFIALKDPDVADSGNVYLGDPVGGTLNELHAYLYAENDFLDVNLDAAGSKAIRLLGTMSAGNQVAIERTYAGGHSKLTVDWDQRLQTGAVTLPFVSTELMEAHRPALLEAWVEVAGAPLGAE